MKTSTCSVEKTTKNFQIIYRPFGAPKEKCWKNKTLFVAIAALILLVPVTFIFRHRFVETFYNNPYRVVCYYTFPGAHDLNSLTPQFIDPYLCTHLIVGFAEISANHTLYLTESQLQILNATTALKTNNPGLKVLISIGGGGRNAGFPNMVRNHTTRKTFIKSINDLIHGFKCDGIDLDWEFPNSVPSKDSKQRMHFTQLLYELRKEINRQKHYKFIVSVAVASTKFLVDLSYDVAYMNDYVDFVNIMTYDFHHYSKITPLTGINSPLYQSTNDFSEALNINYSVNYWRSLGMDPKKINVGLPTYGHTYELFNQANYGLGAPAKGYGHLGGGGFADYADIGCFLRNFTRVVWDYPSRSSYAIKGTEWVSFDTETSLVYKAQYIKDAKVGGAMVFSLNADDHAARCSPNRFPLTNMIKNILS